MIAKKTKIKNSSRFDFSLIFFLVLIIGTLIFLVISNVKIFQKRASMTNEIQDLQEQIQRLEDSKENLELNISKADQDSYWEEQAREQGYVKEGEKQVVVLPPASNENDNRGSENMGFFDNIFKSISDIFNKIIH